MTFDPSLSALKPATRTVTAATTITDADQTVIFNGSAAISQPLPAAGSVTPGKSFTLTNQGTAVLTISSALSGQSNRPVAVGASFTCQSDGTNWIIV